MAEKLLYLTFKDTFNILNPGSRKAAAENIVAQLLAAAERVHKFPGDIWQYLRQDESAQAVLDDMVVKEAIAKIDEPAAAVIAPILTEEQTLDIIFRDLKRTQKSVNIVKFLVQNSGAELTFDELAAGAGITKNDLSSWMAVTSPRIPAITRPSRGVYKFNPNNLNITNHGKETDKQC